LFDALEVMGMSAQSYLLVTLNFVIIGALPALTMRPGRLTAGWWVTVAPMVLAPVTVIAAWSGVLAVGQAGFSELREVLLSVAALASITLVAYTAGSHRIPVALWHQRDDAPVEIVTWGPYRLVRHPFYVSYHLALLAALALIPSWPTMIALLFGTVVLRMTALREEHRLMGSDLGAEYAVYRERTGRFLPRLKAVGR
jgi:protein-S-isoprenylcysteine O-methyltransferase Ste14